METVNDVLYGEWVYGEFDIPHCSECGLEVLPYEIAPKCPCCGAIMENEDEYEEIIKED